MSTPPTLVINPKDCISFFNLCASLPVQFKKIEFESETQKKYAITIADEIHKDDLRKI
jgi:hypothetical protein